LKADEGDEVKLPCYATPTNATNVTWRYNKDRRSPLIFIYINGQIHNRLRQRFGIYNATDGDYSLRIRNAEPAVAGRYRCYDQRRPLSPEYRVSVFG